MNTRCSTYVLFASVVAVAASSVATRASADGPHAELRPAASGDDTAQLQAALSRCTNPRHACDLRLGAGVFHTDLLLVQGFVGSITGRGQGRTIIQPVLDRPLRATPLTYGTEPTLAAPYAYLMHFTNNSRVAISRMTFDIPAAMTIQPYFLPYTTDPAETANTLYAAVAVDGDGRAELQMTQTSFVGVDNASFFGNNLAFAAIFEGQIRLGPAGDMTRRLQHGRVKIYNNRVFRAGNGFMVRTGNDVSAFLGSNLIDARFYGIFTENLCASDFTAVRNNISTDFSGIALSQSGPPPAVPSDYVFAQNMLHVNIEGDAALGVANAGIEMFSPPDQPETIDANVAIWGNDIQIGQSTFQGITLIGASGKGDVRVIGNRLHGLEPMDTGIWVQDGRGGLVAANEMSDIHPRYGDVALLPTSSEVRIFEPGDTYSDQGTNNHVIGVRVPPPPEPLATMAAAAARIAAPTAAAGAADHRRSLLH